MISLQHQGAHQWTCFEMRVERITSWSYIQARFWYTLVFVHPITLMIPVFLLTHWRAVLGFRSCTYRFVVFTIGLFAAGQMNFQIFRTARGGWTTRFGSRSYLSQMRVNNVRETRKYSSKWLFSQGCPKEKWHCITASKRLNYIFIRVRHVPWNLQKGYARQCAWPKFANLLFLWATTPAAHHF